MNSLNKLSDYIKHNRHVLLVLYVPVFLAMFFAAEAIVTPESGYYVIWTPLDDHIPFLEIFVIPYCLWYPLLIVTGLILLILGEADGFKRYMYFIMIGFTVSLLICFAFPNGQNLRVSDFPRENIFTRVVAGLYAADTNTNVFPSIHVVGSIACAAACLRSGGMKRLRAVWVVLAALISLSTVFIKQHSAIDIFGAIALCIPIWVILYGRKENGSNEEKRKVQGAAQDDSEGNKTK